MSKALITDYIALSWSEFSDKHDSKNLDDFLDSIDSLDFQESHISANHLERLKEGDNRESSLNSIRSELRDRDFSDSYISNYINQLDKVRPSDILNNVIRSEILVYFQYNNEKLDLEDLKTELDNQNLTTVNLDDNSKKGLLEQIKFYLTQNTKYEKGLQSLLDEIDEPAPQSSTKVSRRRSSITRVDPKISKDREEIYEFYEERHSLYADMKNTIKEILTLWDKVVEEYEDSVDETGQRSRRETGRFVNREADEETIEDLDAELDELKEIYNMMDDNLNYIMEVPAIPFNITTGKDAVVSSTVRGLALEKFRKILGKEAVEVIQDIQDDDEFDYSDEAGWDYQEEGESTPVAETTLEDKDETEMEIEGLMQEVANINMYEEVDPLFAMSSESGILKKKYTSDSWKKTRNEIVSRLTDAEKNNPGVVAIYKLILDEHEDYKETVFENVKNRDKFYLPATEQGVKTLQKYGDMDIPFEQIESLHNRLVTIIMRILEDPLEASTYPIHMELEDMAPGKEATVGGKREQKIPSTRQAAARSEMFQNFNLFSRVKVGKKGKKREPQSFGKFADSLVNLFEIADSYYGDPVRELMLPFKSVPSYLESDTLSALINHGPENIAQLTLGLYREHFVAFLTPRDLRKITDYVVTSNKAKKNPEEMRKKADGVLDVLQNITPGNAENDLHWFANELKEQARRDSSFNIEGMTLQNRRLDELNYDRKTHKTTYHQVVRLLYLFKTQMLKNPFTKEAMQEFIQAYTNQSDMKMASYAQTQILNAHDDIRKMLGKPIYYNTCQLDSFDHVNDTIDIMKSDYNVDLTSQDIIGIVNEFDSMESLGKKYGMSSDVIYHIKALYR